ncbi:hypothetical protein IFM89_036301, partial [Coptis chinensis]
MAYNVSWKLQVSFYSWRLSSDSSSSPLLMLAFVIIAQELSTLDLHQLFQRNVVFLVYSPALDILSASDNYVDAYQLQVLVQYYLDAIQKLNPTLCSVIEVNSEALSQAAKADNDWILPGGCGCSCGMEGIPVLLKDNIATKGTLNTTSGSFALLNSVVPRDAGVIDRLRKAGAIILGKAGLSQWANYRGTNAPGGWSARGGVKNPYVLTTEPGGSSTGSACQLRCGNKTNFGPTGVIPISLRQDTVGPIGRTVSDAVYLLDVIVGYDPRDDEMTKEACQYIPLGGYKQFP